MNPQDNAALADFLHQMPAGAPQEAALRGACGRAYYFAFVIVRDFLISAKFNVPTRGAHQKTIDFLQRSDDKEVLLAASLFKQLRDKREDADYAVGSRTNTIFGELDSKRALEIAHRVVEKITNAAKADPRMKISLI